VGKLCSNFVQFKRSQRSPSRSPWGYTLASINDESIESLKLQAGFCFLGGFFLLVLVVSGLSELISILILDKIGYQHYEKYQKIVSWIVGVLLISVPFLIGFSLQIDATQKFNSLNKNMVSNSEIHLTVNLPELLYPIFVRGGERSS
jgi:hypothetical protein